MMQSAEHCDCVTRKWRHRADIPGRAPLIIEMVAFDHTLFALDSFALHQIACPPAVSKSVPKRQAEYFCGRLAARFALRHLGRDGEQVGSGGFREPLWPDGVMGSITHIVGLAGAVVEVNGRYAGIGIDIERVVDLTKDDFLSKTVLSAAENQYLHTCSGQLPLDALQTMIFSAKESFFKAAFPSVGHFFDFDAISLSEIDFQGRRLRFRIEETLCASLRSGQMTEVHYSFLDRETVMTVCLLE